MHKFGAMMVAAVGAAAVSVAAMPAAAAPITFDFTTTAPSGGTSGMTLSSGGVTLTATAWGVATSSSPTFGAGYLYRWTGGLGVCNSAEGLGCSSPIHQVDNGGSLDFIMLQFAPGADINSFTVRTTSGAGTDVSYFLGNTDNPLDLVGKKLSDLPGLGFSSRVDRNNPTTSATHTVDIPGTATHNTLLIGARVGHTNDGFKLRTVIVDYTPTSTPVPEPMALALFGLGLLGLGAAARRRAG